MYEEISKLTLWKKSHTLVLQIYESTQTFPKEEIYSLTSQLRRAATSVPCNVVEGRSRDSDKEYLRFLHIARGSLEETRYQLLLAKDLNYLSTEKYQKLENLSIEVSKMLNGLIKKLKADLINNRDG